MPLFPPVSNWTPNLNLPDPTNLDLVAIDVETKDTRILERGPGWFCNDGYIVGFAVAWKGGSTYLPTRHFLGNNTNAENAHRWVGDICKNPNCVKIMHNALYDVGWLTAEGFEIKGEVFDTMFMAALLDEHSLSISLDATVKKFCAGQGLSKDTTLLEEACLQYGLKNPRGDLWILPGDLVGPYGENDAVVTLAAWMSGYPKLLQDELFDIFKLECSLIPMLVEMRRRGVRVDLDKAVQAKKVLVAKEDRIQQQIKDRLGFGIDVWAAASIEKAFKKENLQFGLTETGKPSFTAAFLESLENVHWLPALILEQRRTNKAHSTFIDGLIFNYVEKGRIHTELNPLKNEYGGGTISGRFASRNPNLQQVPGRDKVLTPMIRGIFLPEEGEVWTVIDFSQQEPRLTVHYAALLGLEGVEPFVKGFNTNPKADFYDLIKESTGIDRTPAKILTLALSYGASGAKFCHMLGWETDFVEGKNGRVFEVAGEKGQEVLDLFHSSFPFIGQLNQMCVNRAETNGQIRTLLGRLCRFPYWEPRKWQEEYRKPLPLEQAKQKWPNEKLKRAGTHKALNRLIQGSAADQTKKAMLDLWKGGFKLPLLQIHDELDFSVSAPEEAEELAEIMKNAVDLKVKSRVDIEFGLDWGTIGKEFPK